MSAFESHRDTVLLVEDSAEYAALAEGALGRQWAVAAVRTAREALANVEGGRTYAAMVVDYALPDMSALEILQTLGPRLAVPLIVVSSSDSVPLAVGVMKAGAADYLVKDRTYVGALPLAVAAAIDRYRAGLEHRDVDRLNLLHRDYITGLLNRRRFETLYAQTLARAEATGETVAVAMLDIDGFKNVNDRYGHLAGDRALAAIGQVIREAVWGSDIAARYGGDEFVLVMPDTDLARARVVVRRIGRRLAALNENHALPERVALSIGLAADKGSYGTLLARADAALYTVKRQRRRAGTCVSVKAAPRGPTSADLQDCAR